MHADTTDAGTSPSALLATFQRYSENAIIAIARAAAAVSRVPLRLSSLHVLGRCLIRGDVAMADRALQQLDDGSLRAAAASVRVRPICHSCPWLPGTRLICLGIFFLRMARADAAAYHATPVSIRGAERVHRHVDALAAALQVVGIGPARVSGTG